MRWLFLSLFTLSALANPVVEFPVYCKELQTKFKKFRWQPPTCRYPTMQTVRHSIQGNPLFWVTYGQEKSPFLHNTTLILCGVHGDELTPVKLCFDLMRDLDMTFFETMGHLFVIAPVVNPDSFLSRRPTRTNSRGVDLNRNFPTQDWNRRAHSLWVHRYQRNRRRYPGPYPLSEPESLFQYNLIARYKPDKIISVHSPLSLLDYDGPALPSIKTPGEKLLLQLGKKASDYRIKNYPFFPGSLGNWAGNERQIPTYTLELPSSDPSKSDKYWKNFREALYHALYTPLDFTLLGQQYAQAKK